LFGRPPVERGVGDRSRQWAIVAPGGQRTTLHLDGNCYLASVSYSAGETVTLVSSGDGLLQSMKEPGGAEYVFGYTPEGRLLTDSDPAGGGKTLSATRSGENVSASVATALGRTTVYGDEKLPGGDRRRIPARADGTFSTTLTGRNGVTTTTAPDGSVTSVTAAADPRFGMLTPFARSWSLVSGSKTLSVTATRTKTPANAIDPLALTSLAETMTVNGRTYTSAYDAATRRLTSTSPAGRKVVTTLDANGNAVSVEVPGLAPVSTAYDGFGRVRSVSQGTNSLTFAYDERHRLESMEDALGKAVTYGYDDSDRVTTQTLPDGRVIGFTYDTDGNVTSVTPPARPSHGFAFNPVHLPETYEIGDTVTRYVYNADRQLEAVELPGGSIVDLGYDEAGRLNAVSSASGSIGYAFDAAGRLRTATGGDGSLTYAYDGALLQSVTMAGPVAGTISFSYDSSLRPASETVAGSTVAFGYDADNLLTSAGALALTRHPQHGLLTGTTLGNVRDAWTHTASGEPATYGATYNTTPLLSFTYSRNTAGRITAINDTGYEYDDSGRLERVTIAGTAVA
jgi:YD repeat-containing protein